MDINDAVQHLLFVMILACVTIVRAVNCDDHQCPVACQCSDNNSLITCRNKNLTEVPYNISGPVETIDLSENLVDSIPFASFRNLPNLAVLLMNHNRIARIDDNAFASLTGLEILDLSDNFLDVLSSTTFRDLTSLQVLHLSGNCFPSIPDLQYPRSLKELSVGGDTVEAFKLPSSFHELSLLKKLVLHVGVNVQTINSDDFKWLTSDIEQIVIVGGTNVDINPVGGGAHCLYSHLQYFSWLTGNTSSMDILSTMLSLSRCFAVFGMTVNGFNNVSVSSGNTFGIIENLNVETLYVAFIGSLINEDGSDFASMVRLLALGLYMRSLIDDSLSLQTMQTSSLLFSQLKEFPKLSLPCLQKLVLKVDFEYSTCTGDMFMYMTNLTNLDLSQNALEKIEKGCLTGLSNLQNLDLSDNQIWFLNPRAFDDVPNLKFLYLNSNHFDSLDTAAFNRLVSLHTLDVSSNAIKEIQGSFYSEWKSLQKLDLSHNSLGRYFSTQLFDGLFNGLSALDTLLLSDNCITSLPRGLFDTLLLLKWLDLSDNAIVNLEAIDIPPSSFVNLSMNRLSSIPPALFHQLSSTSLMNFTGNPFACDCDLIPFRLWIADNKINESILVGLSEYSCSSPLSMRGNPLLNFNPNDIVEKCFPPPWKTIVIIAACSVAAIMAICGYVVYRFRWSLRLHVYHISKRLKRQSVRGGYQEIDAGGYDLMVSYFPYDEGGTWVKEVLVPTIDRTERTRRRLEAHSPCEILSKEDEAEFDLFFEERDVTFNEVVIGAVIDAMQDSRKVMLVVTEGYLKDGKCCFEMEHAVHKSCCANHGIDDVIVVLFDESLGVRLLSSLHQSLKLDKVLHWTPNDEDGKRLFWQQLKDRLRQDRQE